MQNLKIDGERLWGELMETAAIGGTPKGGICRLTLSDLDRRVRDWFKVRAEQLGCTVAIDDMGAMFARRRGPGQRDVPPIAMGSHLDTQPTGGKFDGVLGVLGALERAWAVSRRDRSGETFGAALEAIGYRGPERCGAHPLSAFFELHIEQGPILEAEAKDIGIVTGVQGMRWYEASVVGQDAHTGATPMHLRKNALVGATRLVDKVDAIARAHPPLAVGTVGSLEVKPNSPNVVPGEVHFTVDFRHPETAVLDSMERMLFAAVAEVCGPLRLEATATKIWDQPPVAFDAGCIAAVREAAAQSGFAAREIFSGAGHDAAYVARVAPTAMIFVPCRDGISHNEAEFTSKEQCAAGAQVLLQAVLNYDRALAERHAR